ncbi:PPOX class F420-dependent oxidoreductase [Lentzea sp. NBRC 105346]|uniref:PPOX class F420-dependent oxidoreductase n=1 Tax=Lentzea sp. NBRC 105346 TaxID=3032205 RepID=UPI0024A1246F|nr:PPOX class F420-dependent oxidoreductase [Lentzea sp. NBRC 105346]GLZ29688.1 PPOX class F420-dependent oxidoreductase [Lentzea sp. NBRC 105346]
MITELGKSEYLLLTTFRKNGTPVATPVWVAGEGDVIYAWSAKDTGKVKRLRNSGVVEVAPCDFRGNPKGESQPAHATLLSDDESDHVRSLIVKKYGFMGWLTMFGSKIRRGRTGTIGIKIVERQPEVDG